MYAQLPNLQQPQQRQALLKALLWSTTLLLVCWQWSASVSAAPQQYRALYYGPKCTDKQTGRELYVGEFFMRPGQCMRVQCLGTLELWEDTCQEPKLKGNCTRLPVANEHLDYPRCCPMYECKSQTTNEYGTRQETRVYDHYGMLRKTDIQQIFVITDPRDKDQVPGSGVMTQFQI